MQTERTLPRPVPATLLTILDLVILDGIYWYRKDEFPRDTYGVAKQLARRYAPFMGLTWPNETARRIVWSGPHCIFIAAVSKALLEGFELERSSAKAGAPRRAAVSLADSVVKKMKLTGPDLWIYDLRQGCAALNETAVREQFPLVAEAADAWVQEHYASAWHNRQTRYNNVRPASGEFEIYHDRSDNPRQREITLRGVFDEHGAVVIGCEPLWGE